MQANGLVAAAAARRSDCAADLGRRARRSRARDRLPRVLHRRSRGVSACSGAIRCYVPRLVQGVAGSALHPLMRLAYATIENDAEEAGVALGYWAACYLPLPAPRRTAA